VAKADSNLIQDQMDRPYRGLALKFVDLYGYVQRSPRWSHWSTSHPEPVLVEEVLEVLIGELKTKFAEELKQMRREERGEA
jgi:hypothetical protein